MAHGLRRRLEGSALMFWKVERETYKAFADLHHSEGMSRGTAYLAGYHCGARGMDNNHGWPDRFKQPWEMGYADGRGDMNDKRRKAKVAR